LLSFCRIERITFTLMLVTLAAWNIGCRLTTRQQSKSLYNKSVNLVISSIRYFSESQSLQLFFEGELQDKQPI
jgi:hypothetical protein